MKKRNKFTISYCICPICNKRFPIPRVSRIREKGHCKNIWCPFCKEITTMTEIRDCDF